MENQDHNDLLTVAIESDALVIRLPFDALRHAVENCPELEEVDDEGEFAPPIVTDLPKFASEVLKELQHEEEDGTTPVHRMFDGVFVSAIEAGAEGIEVFGCGDYVDAASRAKKGG